MVLYTITWPVAFSIQKRGTCVRTKNLLPDEAECLKPTGHKKRSPFAIECCHRTFTKQFVPFMAYGYSGKDAEPTSSGWKHNQKVCTFFYSC